MGSLKFLALFALLLSLSLVVFADKSNEATHAKDEVKPSEATDAIEPQQRGRGGCRYGCCGAYAYGQCAACCSKPQAVEAKTEANDIVVAKDEVKPSEASDVIEPQQRGCRYGCCGAYAYGQCAACCSRPQATEAKTEAKDIVVAKDEVVPSEATDSIEPQQRGGCRYGCCGSYAFGRCSACCSRPQVVEGKTEAKDVDAGLQQSLVGGCNYGCCGTWRKGRCMNCCASPQAEIEPQQRRSCRYGCCGSYAFGQCSACCPRKMATEEEKQKEETQP